MPPFAFTPVTVYRESADARQVRAAAADRPRVAHDHFPAVERVADHAHRQVGPHRLRERVGQLRRDLLRAGAVAGGELDPSLAGPVVAGDALQVREQPFHDRRDEVAGRVPPCVELPPLRIDGNLHRVTDRQPVGRVEVVVDLAAVGVGDVGDGPTADGAAVGLLAAALGVEERLGEPHERPAVIADVGEVAVPERSAEAR